MKLTENRNPFDARLLKSNLALAGDAKCTALHRRECNLQQLKIALRAQGRAGGAGRFSA
jgi:hypothetical protein